MKVAHSFPMVTAQSLRAFGTSDGALAKVNTFLDKGHDGPSALYFFCDKGQQGLR